MSGDPLIKHHLRRQEVFAARSPIIYARRAVVNGRHDAHDHDFLEVALIGRGRGIHRTIHGAQPVRAGDTFLLRPGAWHAYEQCRALEVFNCGFGTGLLQRELVWLWDDPVLNYLLWSGLLAPASGGVVHVRLPADALARCRAQLDKMAQLGRRPPTAGRITEIGHLVLFLGELARGVEPSVRAKVQGAPRPHVAVAQTMKLLEKDLVRPWSLSELAEALHINRSYLVRLFKAHTGLSPIAYLGRCRAERAAALLLRTQLPITQIGQQVGWEDPVYFARRFRRQFGVSPSQFRQRAQSRKPTVPAANEPR